MGKIVVWIVVVFALLFGLRLLNAAKAKRRDETPRRRGADPSVPMVRCARCGVFLPRVDAKPGPDGFRCGDAGCARQR